MSKKNKEKYNKKSLMRELNELRGLKDKGNTGLQPANHGNPWSRDDYEQLTKLLREGKNCEEISRVMDRSCGGVDAAVRRMVKKQNYEGVSPIDISQNLRLDISFITSIIGTEIRTNEKNIEHKNGEEKTKITKEDDCFAKLMIIIAELQVIKSDIEGVKKFMQNLASRDDEPENPEKEKEEKEEKEKKTE